MKKCLYAAHTFLWVLAIVSSGSASSETNLVWKEAKSLNGYTIYTAAQPDSRFIASKCVTVVDAGMDELGMVLRDFANFRTWLHDCTMSKLLKTIDDERDIFIFYLVQRVPLLPDRDMVLKSNVILNYPKGWCYVGVQSTDEYSFPSSGGLVRMRFKGGFLLEWIDGRHTRLTYTVIPDLQGNMPAIIANPIIRDAPMKSLMKLKERVKLPQYIESAKRSKYRTMINESIRAGHLKP